MNQVVEVKFKKDKSKSPFSTYSKFKSQDINSVEFHLAFDGVDLNESHKVTVHCKFKKSESLVTEVAEVVEGKAIFKFDTRYITQKEEVHCSVYVSKGEQSIDVRTFIFEVELSEIDKGSLRVAGVYDANYQKLIVDFQQQLFDYRDSLPQASELRAEIDVVLNQFGVDSQAKLNQYDADAQQVIADNQTAFGLAESGRQSTYEQAETDRNQASNQAVVDWNLTADALLETVELNESARVDAEATRKTAETDRVSSETTRKSNETTRISNENSRKSAEVIRLASEVDRVNAETIRAEFYEGFDGELSSLQTEVEKKANKKQEDWITPTLLNGWEAQSIDQTPRYYKCEFGIVHLEGCVKSGLNNSELFILPNGYRTLKTLRYPASTGDTTVGRVDVRAGGQVVPHKGTSPYVYLSDFSFRSEW